MKNISYFKENKSYYVDEFLNLNNFLDDKDIELISKLGLKIKNKLYTDYEFDIFLGEILNYHYDKYMSEEEKEMSKSLRKTGVSRIEYNQLLNKINFISEYAKCC